MVKRFLGVGKVQVGLAIMLFFILVAILRQPFCTHVLHTSPYQVDYMTLGGTAPEANTGWAPPAPDRTSWHGCCTAPETRWSSV